MPESPIIIGHRGASSNAPENTLAAFLLALKYKADGIELDAKLTRDGQVVVIHDSTVNRTTNGEGEVKQLTLAEIRSLDAGSKFHQSFKKEKVPLLEEVFEAVGNRMLINVELTNYANPSDDLPEKVAKLVKRFELQETIIFSSFHPRTLLRIRKLLPKVPAGLLALPGAAGAISRSFIGRSFSPELIHPHFTDVSSSSIKREEDWNRKVNVWTVNAEEDLRQMLEIRVNGIITNDIPLASRLRNEFLIMKQGKSREK